MSPQDHEAPVKPPLEGLVSHIPLVHKEYEKSVKAGRPKICKVLVCCIVMSKVTLNICMISILLGRLRGC